jgi:hypothetical protein
MKRELRFEGSKGVAVLPVVFNSGASYSCIHPDFAQGLEVFTPLPYPIDFVIAKKGEKVRAEHAIRVNFYIDDFRLSDEFMVIPDLPKEKGVIIGAATMQKWRIKLDFEKDEIFVDPRAKELWLI